MKILVLVKEVPDTWGDRKIDQSSGRVDRESVDPVLDEIGERALEAALAIKESDKSTEVVVVSMSPSSAAKSLRKGLAMGAGSALHLADEAVHGADLLFTAAALSALLDREGFDLVLAGNESTDGRGGVIPAMIAEHLGVPHLTFMDSLEVRGGRVSGVRSADNGSVEVSAALPAVISITERLPDPRFPNFKGILTAKKKPYTTVTLADLGINATRGASSVVLSSRERPARSGGVKVVDTGNAGHDLAEFLAQNRLI
jgi:electron transfer flavoprotein beta subunit